MAERKTLWEYTDPEGTLIFASISTLRKDSLYVGIRHPKAPQSTIMAVPFEEVRKLAKAMLSAHPGE